MENSGFPVNGLSDFEVRLVVRVGTAGVEGGSTDAVAGEVDVEVCEEEEGCGMRAEEDAAVDDPLQRRGRSGQNETR
jgi:hypothetical protein